MHVGKYQFKDGVTERNEQIIPQYEAAEGKQTKNWPVVTDEFLKDV